MNEIDIERERIRKLFDQLPGKRKFKGAIGFRTSSEIHEDLFWISESRGVSMNCLLNEIVSAWVDGARKRGEEGT